MTETRNKIPDAFEEDLEGDIMYDALIAVDRLARIRAQVVAWRDEAQKEYEDATDGCGEPASEADLGLIRCRRGMCTRVLALLDGEATT